MMRKLSKLVLMALLAAPLAPASAAGPGPGEDSGMKTICYYGVTLKVSNKIAERYMKLGATMGACGQKDPEPEPCPPGTRPVPGGCIPDWIIILPPHGPFLVEKPTNSEKVIQLDLSNDELAKGLLSLDARAVVSR